MQNKENKKLQSLQFKKNILLNEIKELFTLSEQVNEDSRSIFNFHARFVKLETCYKEFEQVTEEIVKLLINTEQVEELEEESKSIKNAKDLYFEILATNLRLTSTSAASNSPDENSNAHQPQVKLPSIDLPSFDGNLKNWPYFKDLFLSLVHNNEGLSDTERFHYLVSCLKSEPLNLTKSLPLLGQNYTIVWNLLVERYDNKRLLATHYFNEILNIPFLKDESFKSLRQLIDVCTENTQALTTMHFPKDYGDFMLCHIVVQRLDPHTRQLFERKHSNVEFPTLDQLLGFLKDHCKSLEACQSHVKIGATNKHYNNAKFQKGLDKQSTQTFLAKDSSTNESLQKCMYCDEAHLIYKCDKFIALSVSQRQDFVRTKQACLNCLSNGHTVKTCRSHSSCRKCFRRHHTLLHYTVTRNAPQENEQSTTTTKTAQHSKETVPTITHTASQQQISLPLEEQYSTLLGTALIEVMNSNGEFQTYRALLDPGSQASFATEACIQALNLPLQQHLETIQGISQTSIETTKGRVTCHIKPRFVNQPCLQTNVIVLSTITALLPSAPLPTNIRKYFKNIELADPHFDVPGKIDFLLGADLFPDIFQGAQKKSPRGFPTAYSSIFGWILLGKTLTKAHQTNSVSHLTLSQAKSLESTIKKFWETEEPPTKHSIHPDEEFCENHFQDTHERDPTGRYIVRLPFKDPHTPLGNSIENAKRRFFSLEKRLNNNPDLKRSYVECMNDYLHSGHMERVASAPEETTPHFFLPHHAVVKEQSSSTKTRIVFDASAQTSSGVSLNQILHTGPKLHNEISDILLNFRCYSIVLLGDIKKMFRQIQVHPEDRAYQMLLWRENSLQPLSVYQLTTVVFGFSSSPYLAIRTLKQLVKDEGENYRLAARALEKQMYVDDLFLGANSFHEAVTLQRETIELLSKGGFELRKWKSNHPELMNSMPEELKEKPTFFQCSNKAVFSFLGIKWTAENDNFTFHFAIDEKEPTKRNILSTVAQIFDPCGWLSPITFWTKSLIQLLWTLGLQWDEPVAPNIAEKWTRFLSQLPELDNINIPRCLPLYSATGVQIHGFSDASEAGYSAAVYTRIVCSDGRIEVQLLIAKSKVAPLKKVSIPRLELCGAHLLAKLMNYSIKIFSEHCQITTTTAWCDSQVALSWIRTPPYKLKVFVANRVTEIQDLLPAHLWSYIPTDQNPADCASRGVLPESLKDHNLWWNGPEWLRSSEDTWPKHQFEHIKENDLPEIKSDPIHLLLTREEPKFVSKYSSWTKLIRVVSYILRFRNNLKCQNKEFGCLKLYELDNAKNTIFKVIQQAHYYEDYILLKKGKNCTANLLPLSPFIDENDLIRVGGRIKNAPIPYKAKYPILLPKKSHVTNLIVDYYHLKYLHCGPQFLQATVSQLFWIMSARSVIRTRIFKCNRCFRCQPKFATQKMGDLPEKRVTPSKVFDNCGTDFLGPFSVKPHSLRKVNPLKVYICVFVCFSVKAVHLEVVTNLTTDAYIAALTRFVSRRGLCSNIYSDCGRNFVGAAAEIGKIIKRFLNEKETQDAIIKFSNDQNINFHFLPPAAPHQGGLWERTVRSIKHHLHRVIGQQILTLEEFITLSTKIEAILNSRPISQLSSDPSEIDFLSPGHFLIGRPLVALPEPDYGGTQTTRLSRWQLIQSMTQHFWKRWSLEYLHTLQKRGKWQQPQENIKIGDLVVVHEPNSTPLSWRLGRIIETSPGADGLVRVVKIRTARGTISRPITKVSFLPANEE